MPAPEPIPIRISCSGQVIPVDQIAKVKKAQKTNLKWVALDGCGPWIIKFNKVSAVGANYPVEPGSPFGQSEYEVPRGGSVETTDGPVKGKSKKTYRYTVTDKATGTVTHDPDVDVE